jgi:hypothetical protein
MMCRADDITAGTVLNQANTSEYSAMLAGLQRCKHGIFHCQVLKGRYIGLNTLQELSPSRAWNWVLRRGIPRRGRRTPHRQVTIAAQT